MIADIEKQFLLRAIGQNRAVLFVGAGFSQDAKNSLGQQLPDSKGLAEVIWKWCGYPGEWTDDKTPLAIVFQAALTSGKSTRDLSALLEAHLLATSIAPWYAAVPKIPWYRIYGTNIDNVIEFAFAEAKPEWRADVLAAPRDEYRDRDQFVGKIQYVKLNGSLPGDANDLTFATLQYARRAKSHDEWYHHFVRDYVFQPTVFVGSELDEQLFWNAIASRESRGDKPEERPSSFLVTPSVSPAKAAVLKGMNITHVASGAKDFFAWLEVELSLPTRAELIRRVNPEAAAILGVAGISPRIRDALTEFLSCFQRVPQPSATGGRPKFFLLGAPPTWEDIAGGLDASREFTRTLLKSVDDAFQTQKELIVFGVLSEGGGGKSTILRRISFDMRQQGRQVFFADGTTRPDIRSTRDAIASFAERVVLVIDNASLIPTDLSNLLKVLKTVTRPPVVLFGARFLQYEQRLRSLVDETQFRTAYIPDLTAPDIDAIINKLDEHNQLGLLHDLTPSQRVREFTVRARKQILVAMREATEGKDFDKIIAAEFAEIEDYESRVLFLCAALGTDALVDLTEKQLLDCTDAAPAEALNILRHKLRGLIRLGDARGTVVARHPVIAQFILDSVAGRGDVVEAYRRLLVTLSRDIYSAGRRQPAWRLFTRLISHTTLYDRFGEDIERARAVFELTSPEYSKDGHFWLQYANLEIDYGLAEYARGHLANAEGLLGDTDLVQSTKAHMWLVEALTAANYEEALQLRRDAERILLDQIERDHGDDEYPYHIYLSHTLNWIRSWEHSRDKKKEALEQLLQLASEAIIRHPSKRKLKSIQQAINREYLTLAVRTPTP